MLFVNLPLSWVAREARWLDMFIERNIAPELGMDTVAVQSLPESWHKVTASRIRDAGLECAVHLPFFDLHPGSLNDGILKASRETLARGVAYAALYAPQHMVGHVAWDEGQHASARDSWLERSCGTWQAVLEGASCPLRLENTFEGDPAMIAQLVTALPAPRVGICFDVGHWFSFAGGARRNDLGRWLDAFAHRLAHLHLHDNDGSGDQHLGVGDGGIPWESLFSGLKARGVVPSATLEPHDETSFIRSMEWLEAHPEVGAMMCR